MIPLKMNVVFKEMKVYLTSISRKGFLTNPSLDPTTPRFYTSCVCALGFLCLLCSGSRTLGALCFLEDPERDP